MSREVHVRFCERPGVRFPRATRLVICARFIGTRIRDWLDDLMARMGLTLNQDKTSVISLQADHTALDFLGFCVRYARSKFGGRFGVITPSPSSVIRAMRHLGHLTRSKRCFMSSAIITGEMNQFLRGWSAYFDHGYAGAAFRQVDWHARNCLKRHMKRRSQRPFRPPKGVMWYQHIVYGMGLCRIAGRCRGANTRIPWESRMLEICMSGSMRAPAGS